MRHIAEHAIFYVGLDKDHLGPFNGLPLSTRATIQNAIALPVKFFPGKFDTEKLDVIRDKSKIKEGTFKILGVTLRCNLEFVHYTG